MSTRQRNGRHTPEDPSRIEWRQLDPATAVTVAGVEAGPTVYAASRLLVSSLRDLDPVLTLLRATAAGLGWSVTVDEECTHARLTEPVR